jgi:hypothetical protein
VGAAFDSTEIAAGQPRIFWFETVMIEQSSTEDIEVNEMTKL